MRWHQSTIMGPVELAVVTSLARPGTRNGLEKEYADAAPRYCLPAMHELEYGARIGGLVSDGPDFGDVFRRAGRDVGRILKGGKPAEMAIEEPRKCHPVTNLATARALGIAVWQGLPVLADEVVE